jgi:cytochrome b561
VLHWFMAGLFALAIGGIVTRGLLPSGHAWRPELRSLHIVCGQLVLAFGLMRLLVRVCSRMPPTPSAPRWATRAGHAAHMALYGVMLAQPISGIVFMQAGDKKVIFFGWVLPRIVESNVALQSNVKEWHLFVGNAFYLLLALHVSAALWHHFMLKNDTLRRMLKLRDAQRAPMPEAAPPQLPATAQRKATPTTSAPTPSRIQTARPLARDKQVAHEERVD